MGADERSVPERPLQPQYVQPVDEQFDPWDEALMHDLMGNERMGNAAADIIQAIDQFDRADGSFGADDARAVAFLIPKLRAFRQACIDQWRSEQ